MDSGRRFFFGAGYLAWPRSQWLGAWDIGSGGCFIVHDTQYNEPRRRGSLDGLVFVIRQREHNNIKQNVMKFRVEPLLVGGWGCNFATHEMGE